MHLSLRSIASIVLVRRLSGGLARPGHLLPASGWLALPKAGKPLAD